ncbi:MAG: PAS domain S-box protein [Comamonadaceae bacterium]|nr:MAG: PAS domain S-box protein [Comamonadaceae bacterium]
MLWILLLALVFTLLSTLIWLAGRYETSQIQSRLERDTIETATDIRTGLARNVQTFQALQSSGRTPQEWPIVAVELLRDSREIMRLEWRDANLNLIAQADTPYRPRVFQRVARNNAMADLTLACGGARKLGGASYSGSYFLPQPDGLGFEVLDMCLPIQQGGQVEGFVVATYSLQEILSELVGRQIARGHSVSFTEADGTRLALHGSASRGSRVYVAQQLLDLPGNTLVIRTESRQGTPAFFPNVLTALVTAMSLALMAVLFLLVRDMRRRLKVEHDLGEALAFRKAMEDSVLTGLRARDLQGRITYVNPAFCQMVGREPSELLLHSFPSPYWPPEYAEAYQQRQEIRLAGNNLPREGHESVFMRRDGTRFPVLIMEAPLINAMGTHTGWMSAILDVSEQRRVEELSRASQDRLQATARLAMVGEMASLLSHELNQPLAAISSYATGSLNLLQDHAGQPASPKDAAHGQSDELSRDLQLAMRRIAEQAERAGKIIKSVHGFVRRRDQSREAVPPRDLLDAIMPLVILQARKLSVRVQIDIDPASPPVLCDRTMVEQVLLNLSRNGMQSMQNMHAYNTAARVIALRVRPLTVAGAGGAAERVDRVEFSVTDRGEGISDDVARQLFTPFFTTKEEGMGLGLSLCRTVIEQHGGALEYTAVQPHGTAFTFTLPVARAAAGDSGGGTIPSLELA